MSQILIVEGNDAIVLSKLCELHRLPPPTGYSSRKDYETKFIKPAGGFEKALIVLKDRLDELTFTHIGLIIDANDKGAASRWDKVKNILSAHFSDETLNALGPKPDGIIVREEGLPVVGVWIMPDNRGEDYLEHFVSAMVPADDALWGHANGTVSQLEKEEYCRFKPIKRQKALLHTWLAWQEEPGEPFGTALESHTWMRMCPSFSRS